VWQITSLTRFFFTRFARPTCRNSDGDQRHVRRLEHRNRFRRHPPHAKRTVCDFSEGQGFREWHLGGGRQTQKGHKSGWLQKEVTQQFSACHCRRYCAVQAERRGTGVRSAGTEDRQGRSEI